MYKKYVLVVLFVLMVFACRDTKVTGSVTIQEKEMYHANWESLSQHEESPQWFQDAKFGIYFHWGVYSVPAYGSEWYPWNMYRKGTKEFQHHKQAYGSQETFGYHNFVPQFKAEHFDADEWVALFKKAGAKFAGPVAQHHDGFAMWNSKVNPWNSVNKGPKRDITGEIALAVRKNDLKLITTFHHARNLQRNAHDPNKWGGFESHFTYNPAYHTSSKDKELSILYGNIPEDKFHENWSTQITEVVNQYHPDMIWFDSWLNYIPEKRRQQMCADFFNATEARGQEGVIGYKQADLPKEVGVLDIEQGGRKDITDRPWMTDITLSNQSWSYVEGQTYKEASLVLRNLIDVVSKNGVVLLNVSPKADGTISNEQRKVLGDLGDWFARYGESIYNTIPWYVYGYGTAKAQDGHFGGQSATVKYTASDIRFTQSKDKKSMYLFFLGKPETGEKINLDKLAKHRSTPLSPIKRIVVLGTDLALDYENTDSVFNVTIPEGTELDDLATVLKFELE